MNEREKALTALALLQQAMLASPELPAPSTIDFSTRGQVEIRWFVVSAEEIVTVLRNMPNDERWAKNDPNEGEYDATYYVLTNTYNGINLRIVMPRGDTCERIQVGTQTVVREVTQVVETVEVEEPVYKFKCAPILPEAQKRLDAALAEVSA